MNRKYLYVGLLVLFFVSTAFILLRYDMDLHHKVVAFYPLQERKGALREVPDWTATQSTASRLIRIVRENGSDKKSALALAALYIQEGRITGNHNYYDEAALHYIEQVLNQTPAHFEALTLKALVQLSQHHFSEALLTAAAAQKLNPYNAFVYGLLVDGYVETGQYQKAVEASDKMVSIRPDIRSYSRIAYLREIHGDYPGAIEAMKMAIGAGGYGDEATAWTRVQLARLYEATGDLQQADMHYRITLNQRPAYPYAVAGLAHLAMLRGDYPTALKQYAQADESLSDGSMKEHMVRLYRLMGDPKKASELIGQRLKELQDLAKHGAAHGNNEHHVDGELAELYELTGDYDKALHHALEEWRRRPKNIEVNDRVAWAYYQKGNIAKAVTHIEKALVTGTRQPLLLAHAGLIYTRLGDRVKAKLILSQAMSGVSVLDPELGKEVRATLQSL
jgi:tetratricopeptide (TPR) repeat protein